MVSTLAIKLVMLSLVFILVIGFVLIRMVRLVQKVTERDATNKAELESEKKNSNMQKSFLANMSHELRTPLNAIIGFSKMLKKTREDKNDQTSLNHLLDASNTMLYLINDILDFSKIESGEMDLNFEDFDVASLLKSVCDSLRPKVSDKVYFNYDFQIDTHHHVYGDPNRVKQILLNVINNAVKYTKHGEIKIIPECIMIEEKVVFRCSVADTGIGISETLLPTIFTPFKQVHNKVGAKTTIVGTGLGLAIVKSLLDLMDGKVWCESEKDKGTVFYIEITFPVGEVKEELKRTEKFNFNDLKLVDSAHVLVAEDNHFNQLIIQNTLKNSGITCDIASNGEEVLKFLETGKYKLILMDIQMPVLGGVETTGKIRDCQKPYNELPIIALTANAIKGDMEYYLSAGMDGYVSKPIDDFMLFF
jgi:signal transduction histidine kinase/CheY-like chemotaxis protein